MFLRHHEVDSCGSEWNHLNILKYLWNWHSDRHSSTFSTSKFKHWVTDVTLNKEKDIIWNLGNLGHVKINFYILECLFKQFICYKLQFVTNHIPLLVPNKVLQLVKEI